MASKLKNEDIPRVRNIIVGAINPDGSIKEYYLWLDSYNKQHEEMSRKLSELKKNKHHLAHKYSDPTDGLIIKYTDEKGITKSMPFKDIKFPIYAEKDTKYFAYGNELHKYRLNINYSHGISDPNNTAMIKRKDS